MDPHATAPQYTEDNNNHNNNNKKQNSTKEKTAEIRNSQLGERYCDQCRQTYKHYRLNMGLICTFYGKSNPYL